MFTAGIVILALLAGSTTGIVSNKKSVVKKLHQAHHQARDLKNNSHRQDRKKRQRIIMDNHQASLKYRQTVNEELTNQGHDNSNLLERLNQRKRFLDQNEARLAKLESAFQGRRVDFSKIQSRYHQVLDQIKQLTIKKHHQLNQQGQLDDQTAKNTVLSAAAAELKRERDIEVKYQTEESEDVAMQKAKDIIVEAIQRGPLDLPRNHIERNISIPNFRIKRRLISHNLEHLRLVESMTGTDLFFDPDDARVLHIGTNDPIRREVARRALSGLIVSWHITDHNIETQVWHAEKEVDYELRRIGEKVVERMHLGWMHPDMLKILGRLKFRTSYGQNVLYHSMEVGQMAGVMASELGLNARLARRAGLLHDVGKSIDHEVVGTHVELGVKLAKVYHENPIVVNAIASHHGDVEATNPISLLVSTSDALSGARPGARSESIEEYIKRLKNLESIANQQNGVKESYAIQAGRELRIIIDPRKMNDEQSAELTKHVRDRIQNELSYPGKIKITTIRMLRAIQYVGGYYYRHRHYHHHRSHRYAKAK